MPLTPKYTLSQPSYQTRLLLNQVILKAKSSLPVTVLIDQMKDLLSQTWEKESREAIIAAIQEIEELTGEVTWDELARIEVMIAASLGAPFAELVKKPLIEINKAVFLMGMKEAAEVAGHTAIETMLDWQTGLGIGTSAMGVGAPAMAVTTSTPGIGTSIMWNLPDLKSLDILNQDAFFWIGSHYDDDVREAILGALQDYFEGGYSRQQLAMLMKVQFRDLLMREKSYWELLADHTINKIREIGRISGYEQAGIKYVRFRARMDHKTSWICRSMHNRIIPVSSAREHVDNYLSACQTKNKDKIKASWPWMSESKKNADIVWRPVNEVVSDKVCLPPLHARCRSITVAYFPGDSDFRDEFGRGYTVPEDIRGKIQRKHLSGTKYKSVDTYIQDCLKNIDSEGIHINDSSKNVLSCNGGKDVLFVGANGNIESFFRPTSKAYYENRVQTVYFDKISTLLSRVKKWLQSFI